MTTEQQIAANRRNALDGTGPRSPAGKTAVGRNAIRHGLLARAPVAPDEDRGVFDEMREALLHDMAPSGMLETALVDRMAELFWRLRRIGRMESAAIAQEYARHTYLGWQTREHLFDRAAKSHQRLVTSAELEATAAGGETTDPDVAYAQAFAARQLAEDRLSGPDSAIDAAYAHMVRDGTAFDNVSRYATSLHRELDATLKQFWVVRAGRSRPRRGGTDDDAGVVDV